MTLIVVLIVILMIAVMGGVAVSFAQTNAKSAERSADTSLGDAIADAALSHARSILWEAPNPLDPDAVPKGQVKLFGGKGTYSGQLSGNVWTLTASSEVKSGAQTISRTVSTQVSVEAGGGGPAFAVFTADADCGGGSLELSPAAVDIKGAVRTNGDLVMEGKDVSVGHMSVYGPPCVVTVASTSAELQTLSAETLKELDDDGDDDAVYVKGASVDPTVHYWPAVFDEADFVCTYRETTFNFTMKGMVIPAGVYCADESFTVAGNGLSGNITVIAPKIEVHGTGHTFTPYQHEVLFYANATEPMLLAGTSYTWEGIVYHPGGRVEISGDEFSILVGMIEARETLVLGKAFRMLGTGPAFDLGGDGVTLEQVPGSYVSG